MTLAGQAPAGQGKLGVLSVHNAEIRADDDSTVAVCYGTRHSHADRRARILSHAHNCHSELVDALLSLRERLDECVRLGLSAHEAYDSFYQEMVKDTLSRATGSQP